MQSAHPGLTWVESRLVEGSEEASAKLTSQGSRNFDLIGRMPRCPKQISQKATLREEVMAGRLCEPLAGQDRLQSLNGHDSQSSLSLSSCGQNKDQEGLWNFRMLH